MTLVVDASALVELALASPLAPRVAEQLERHGNDLNAPELVDIEVLSALRREVLARRASVERVEQALDVFLDLPLELFPHRAFVRRTWGLRDNFSSYDATYLALAEALSDRGAALLTADGRFARAARTHSDVEVLLVS